MLYISTFAAMGLGFSTTKFISEDKSAGGTNIGCIIRDSIKLTSVFSVFLAVCLFLGSSELAQYLNEPSLVTPLRFLSLIIILKAFCTTLNGILSGLGLFKAIGLATIGSGIFMLFAAVPLSYSFGLLGAIVSLSLSQLINVIIDVCFLLRSGIRCNGSCVYLKTLFKFSFPLALQESTYSICQWAALLLLGRYSAVSEVGVYTACSQWNAIIFFIPQLLVNVLLSHLSGSLRDSGRHKRTLKVMLMVNFLCTAIPFAIVYILSDFIVSFYGSTFAGMQVVLRMSVFVTIICCVTDVLRTELIAIGKTWSLFFIRASRDLILVFIAYFMLVRNNGHNGAYQMASSVVVSYLYYAVIMVLVSLFYFKRNYWQKFRGK